MSLIYSRSGRPVHHLIPLEQLEAGQTGRIDRLSGEPGHVHRLQELGLGCGAEIEMIQPGSPCIIRLSGHKLCFRADDLVHVLVSARHVC